MPNRRELLRMAAAAGTWPLVAAMPAVEAAMPRHRRVPIHTVVFDRRYPQSIQFGQRAAELGLETAAMNGDMTRIWYDDVSYAWKRGPVAVAGLTEHGPLFCFEQLGRDTGMRVVFRAVHTLRGSGELVHELTGPAPMIDACAALEAETLWPATIAEAVAGCPADGRQIRSATHVSLRSAHVARSEPLFSWVIAPAAQRS